VAEPPRSNWWATLPGILTAAAAVITAITALIGSLHQAGVFSMFRAAEQRREAPLVPPAVASRAAPAQPASREPLQARVMEAWTLPDGGAAVRLLLRNTGSEALLVEPARDVLLRSEGGTTVSARRAVPVFHTLAAGEGLEATVEFPALAGSPALLLRGAPGPELPRLR
jgi:hypothetical protein